MDLAQLVDKIGGENEKSLIIIVDFLFSLLAGWTLFRLSLQNIKQNLL